MMSLIWIAALLLLAAASALPVWAEIDWRVDLFSHFRLQYAVAGLLLALFLLWRKRRVFGLVALGLGGYNAWWVVSLAGLPETRQEGETYRALTVNVHSENADVDRVLKLIQQTEPDILGLLELTDQWQDAYKELEQNYPFHRSQIWPSGFGMALYSRFPIAAESFNFAGVQTLAARLQLPDGPLLVILAHTLSPTEANHWRWRNQAFEQIAGFSGGRAGEPRILMGDLNCTPWSPFFQSLKDESGLSLPRCRLLPRRTWPAPYPLLGIPIDHFLISAEIRPRRDWVGPDIGSDHYPVFLDFQVRRQPANNTRK